MIELVLPNHVRIKTLAQAQQAQGIIWFGKQFYPHYTLVKLQPGTQPLRAEGVDLIFESGQGMENYAVYGDKKLLRHAIDTDISENNSLFFPGWGKGHAAAHLIMWLLKKTGRNMTPADIKKAKKNLNDANLAEWCTRITDSFDPENLGYFIRGEPSAHQLKGIFKV